MTNFEPVYSALFAALSSITGIKSASRRLKHWSDVPAKDQPALFVTQTGEASGNIRGLPSPWRLSLEVYVYVNVPGDKVAPSTVLNPLLAAIREAVEPAPGQPACTLGGLASHCWISGEIEIYDGVLGHQAVALIPFEILVP